MDYLVNPAKFAFRMAKALDETPMPESLTIRDVPNVEVVVPKEIFYIRRDHRGLNYVVHTGTNSTHTFDGVTVGPVANDEIYKGLNEHVTLHNYSGLHKDATLASITSADLLRFLSAINNSILEINARLIPRSFQPMQTELRDIPHGETRWACTTYQCEEAAREQRRYNDKKKRHADNVHDAREQKRHQYSPPDAVSPP